MAEALARHYWEDSLEVLSAGVYPLGKITPYTLDVLMERNIPTDGLHSKGLAAVDFSRVDVVVDLADFPVEPVPGGFEGKVVKAFVPDPYGGTLDDFREALATIDRILKKKMERWTGVKTVGPG